MEKEQFLPYHERDSTSLDSEAAIKEDLSSYQLSSEKRHSPLYKTWKTYGIPVIALLIGLTIGTVGSKASTHINYRHWTTSWTPAMPHISFKPQRDQEPKTPESDPWFLYSGPISRKQEIAWTQLVYPVTMPMTKDQMELAGENPDIKAHLADGTHYAATLGVYHELHCLRKIRRLVYQDFWYTNSTDEEIAHEREHADHCLHQIHKSLTCYADVGVNTFQYRKGVPKPATVSNSERMCVDWEKLHDWATSVSVGVGAELFRPEGF